MELLKNKRAPLRTAFTKAYNLLKEKLGEKEPKITEIEISLEQLMDKANRLREVDQEFLDALLTSGAKEKEYAQEFEACEVYVEKFIQIKTEAKQICSSRDQKSKVKENIENESETRNSQVQIKLPKINLIQFDGDPRKWLNFWNTFIKIHEDDTLDEHSKFVYLIQSTIPNSKVREIVNSYPCTADNYSKVIEHIRSRFGNNEILIQVYVRDLLQLVLANYTSNQKLTLSSLYDKLETKLRALESLGVTKDKYASIIFPLVESCLPTDILRIWEREREKSTEIRGKSDLESLLEFLKTEVLTEERMLLAHDNFGLNKTTKSSKNRDLMESDIPTCHELWVGEKQHNKIKMELCLFCEKPHPTEKCFKAETLSYQEKKDLLFKRGACYICLKRGENHISRNCRLKSKVRCSACQKVGHLSILCPPAPKSRQTLASDEAKKGVERKSVANDQILSSSCLQDEGVLLQTLVVKITNGSRQKNLRAIIDSGSMNTYVSSDVIEYLRCESVGEKRLIHQLFGGVQTSEELHHMYKICVNSLDNDFSCEMLCLNKAIICSDVKRISSKGPWSEELKACGIKVNDIQGCFPEVGDEIKMLIGSDVAGKLFTGKVKCLKSGPVAMQTKLGWILMGKVPNFNERDTHTCVSLLLNERSAENFWRLDTIGITDPVEAKTKLELQKESMLHFEKNLRVDSEGRYEIALPWVLDRSRLPSNRELAEKRLETTRKKLMHSNKIGAYQEVFDNWLEDNIIEEVRNDVRNEHYLPHRPIFKEASTTKVRPVFDASAHSKGAVSLNECLEKGPNLLEIIPSLINRFRKFPVGVVSDIEKAFLQISIREEDRDFLRFLWKGVDEKDIKVYRHRRVVFGLTCSPFLLAATLNCHLDNATECFLDTAKTLKESFYVDNCLVSFKTVEELDKFVMLSRTLLSAAKFNLRGWRTNGESEVISQAGLEENICVLGLDWNAKDDTLSCKIETQTEGNMVASKRSLLSCTNKLFDPMGFTSPVTLFPKLALQECWKQKLSWDEKLPEPLEKQFSTWLTKMKLLKEIKIPRWMGVQGSIPEDVSLHVFCDASRQAYATAIFIRIKTNEHISVNLVQSRTRVSPLKNVTIPRLELLGCTIGARLGNAVTSDLKIGGIKRFFWCDSTTALTWIRRDVHWGTFVWNRVQEIRTLTKIEEWRHIPTELNSADLPSRGCSVEHFLRSKWWEGPIWLKGPEESWPSEVETPDEEVVNSEKRKSVLAATGGISVPNEWFYRYFSSFPRILRLVAWILRFLNNARKTNVCKEIELSLWELKKAEETIFILIQKESFSKNEKQFFKNLRTLVKRILRKVLGRAVLSYEELLTVICDCEQVINTRPLTYVSGSPEDPSPLTPAMFLQTLSSSDVEDIDLVDCQGLNNRIKHVQSIRDHLRKRFRSEYLGQLKQQTSGRDVKPLSVNDVVIVEDDHKRAQWTLARIVELFPGKDGHSRVARVKTQQGEFIRPVQRLYNLEVNIDSPSELIVRTRSGRQVIAPKRLNY